MAFVIRTIQVYTIPAVGKVYIHHDASWTRRCRKGGCLIVAGTHGLQACKAELAAIPFDLSSSFGQRAPCSTPEISRVCLTGNQSSRDQEPTSDHSKPLFERCHLSLRHRITVECSLIIHRHATVRPVESYIRLDRHTLERAVSRAEEHNRSPVVTFILGEGTSRASRVLCRIIDRVHGRVEGISTRYLMEMSRLQLAWGNNGIDAFDDKLRA